MLSTALPVKAQDVKAQVDAITKVVIDNKGDVKATKDAVKEFTKTFKKNPQALAGLGRAFFDGGNEAEALKYADMAIKANKNSAFGYLLKGDMAAVNDNAGEAAMWYQTATQFDPQDPTGYVKYARVYQKVDPKGAVEMLEKLRQVKPDYPVDAAAGYMYSNANKLKSAMEYYDKVKDVTKLDDYILSDYATTAFVMEQYEKTLDLAKKGIQTYPDFNHFNRLAFYSNNKLKNYGEAAQYAEKMFNKKDTLKFTVNDYQNYGDVLYNLDRTEEAIKAYKMVQELDPSKNEVYKLISDVYTKKKDYENAVTHYNKYLELLGDEGNANHLRGLADIYIEQMDGADEAGKLAALRKADQVYADMETKYTYAADYAAYQRALLHYQIMPSRTTALPRPRSMQPSCSSTSPTMRLPSRSWISNKKHNYNRKKPRIVSDAGLFSIIIMCITWIPPYIGRVSLKTTSAGLQTNLLCTSKHHQINLKTPSADEQSNLVCTPPNEES